MASDKGLMSQAARAAKDNPAVDRLREEATGFLQAKGKDLTKNLGSKLESATGKLTDHTEGGGAFAKGAAKSAKKIAEGENPAKAAAFGLATGVKEKVKSAFGGGGAGGGKPKMTHIMEDIDVGVPVETAYNQWTQFAEFAHFTKGVEDVNQDDEVKSTWKVKVFKSARRMNTTITEQEPYHRIAWTSEGDKGSTKGVVTFHPLANDLTKILLVLEYYPGGFMEKTGNIWRAGGRRARLDLKHFRRFVMMEGAETGAWLGTIEDSEVVKSHEEGEEELEAEDRSQPADRDQDLPEEDEYEEDEYEEEGESGEEPEDEYEEEEEPEEEEPEEEEPEDEYEVEEEEEPDEEEAPRRRRRR